MGAGHPIIGSQRSVKSLYLAGYVNSGYLMLMLCPYKEVEAGLDVRSGHVIYDKWLLHFTSPTGTQMKNVGERRRKKSLQLQNAKFNHEIWDSSDICIHFNSRFFSFACCWCCSFFPEIQSSRTRSSQHKWLSYRVEIRVPIKFDSWIKLKRGGRGGEEENDSVTYTWAAVIVAERAKRKRRKSSLATRITFNLKKISSSFLLLLLHPCRPDNDNIYSYDKNEIRVNFRCLGMFFMSSHGPTHWKREKMSWISQHQQLIRSRRSSSKWNEMSCHSESQAMDNENISLFHGHYALLRAKAKFHLTRLIVSIKYLMSIQLIFQFLTHNVRKASTRGQMLRRFHFSFSPLAMVEWKLRKQSWKSQWALKDTRISIFSLKCYKN